MKNMVQIHDEQRSIQKTISRRDTRKNTAQTSTVIINNGSKNNKCRPISERERERETETERTVTMNNTLVDNVFSVLASFQRTLKPLQFVPCRRTQV